MTEEKNMKSKTFEQAKIFYDENKDRLIQVLLNEYPGDIEYQREYDQVAVSFDGFSLCYQNSDMNGDGKGEAHWDNDGADSGLNELKDILSEDPRCQPLIAEEEYWENEYLNDLISDFCKAFAEKNNITDYFEYNDIKLQERLNEIKYGLGTPDNKYEKMFYDFLDELIKKEWKYFDFDSDDEWTKYIDELMQISFENEILEEADKPNLQEIFSDNYYSSVQDVRDARMHVSL